MNRECDHLHKTVSSTIERHSLFRADSTVIVAVSGGVDSVTLLDYLAMRRDLGLRIVVAHLNHSLRGEESDADEELVREISAEYGARFERCRVDVKAMARNERLSLEEAGREARYRFFADLASRCNASAVALAHHRDDQAETVLMRLLRGSGPAGLRGMGYRSGNGLYVRPFLDADRSAIEEYAAARGLRFRTDSSNSDPRFLRNRVRLQLLPLLGEYNPEIVSRLADTAAIMAADEELLSESVSRCWEAAGRMDSDGVSADCARLRNESSGMRLRIYRHALTLLAGTSRRIAYRHLRAIDDLMLSGSPNGRLHLPGGLTAIRSYETIRFAPDRRIEAALPYEFIISGTGQYDLPHGGRVVVAAVDGTEAGASRLRLTVSLGAFPFPWTIRTFRPGDRLVPSGMTGHKKVKDLFIDLKVPSSIRSSLPLFYSGSTLFWVAGVRAAAQPIPVSEDSEAVTVDLLEFPNAPAILG